MIAQPSNQANLMPRSDIESFAYDPHELDDNGCKDHTFRTRVIELLTQSSFRTETKHHHRVRKRSTLTINHLHLNPTSHVAVIMNRRLYSRSAKLI